MVTKYKFRYYLEKYFLPVTFGMIIIGLVVYSVTLHNKKNQLELQLQGIYQQSFQELMLDMRSLETELSKLEAANDNYQNSMILMDIWRQTGDTESSISQLPVSYNQASPFIQYINRTGDYCRYLSKKVSEGQKITGDDLDQVKALRQSSINISNALDKAWQTGYLPNINMDKSMYISTASTSTAGNLDFSNEKYPRLIYDGPYSESIENKKPEGLEGEDIDENAAKQKVIEFLGQQNIMEVTSVQSEGGRIPCFSIDGKLKDGNDFSINLTKKGGEVLWYMQQTNGRGNAVPSDEKYNQLSEKALSYLSEDGITNAAATYAQFYGGNAIINVVPTQDDILLYPDLIKVWVDIEQDKVVGLDRLNYVMSHKKRDIAKPKLSKEQAATYVTERLKIVAIQLALIPTDTKQEVVCWEFTGKIDKQDYIIYIDAETGKTENIFIIKHTNEGTLVQ
jgi:spore germination protein